MAWYYAVNDERIGPVAIDDLHRLMAGGTVTEATLVWTRGMDRWQPIQIALKGHYVIPNTSAPRRFNGERTWHYVHRSGRFGPIPGAQMDVLYHEGTITNDTYVWTKGLTQWQRLGTLLPVQERPSPRQEPPPYVGGPATGEVKVPASDEKGVEDFEGPNSNDEAPPIEACAGCGRFYNSEEMVAYRDQWVCIACKPEFFQREREGFDQRPTLPFAGFWIRCFARVVDILVVNVMLYGLSIILINVIVSLGAAQLSGPDGAQLLVIILAAILAVTIPMTYETYFVGRYGATPGKMVVDIQVVCGDGQPVSYGRALARFFMALISQLLCFAGCLSVAFDREKRGAHDYVCDTRVILK